MTRIVFHAYSAYVGNIESRTICSFWTDDPASPAINWDPAKRTRIDLSHSLRNAASVGHVDIDDHVTDGGLTTIGPIFPGGTMIGAAWINEEFIQQRCKSSKPNLPGHAHPYELKAIVFTGDPTYGNRRFQGFHAKILGTQPHRNGVLSHVQLWVAGTGRSGNPVGSYWLDLDAIAHPDKVSGEVGPKGAADGALFLDMTQRNAFGPMTAAAITTSGVGGAGGGGGGGGVVVMGGGTGPKIPPAYGLDY
jgi:hypothetical protein